MSTKETKPAIIPREKRQRGNIEFYRNLYIWGNKGRGMELSEIAAEYPVSLATLQQYQANYGWTPIKRREQNKILVKRVNIVNSIYERLTDLEFTRGQIMKRVRRLKLDKNPNFERDMDSLTKSLYKVQMQIHIEEQKIEEVMEENKAKEKKKGSFMATIIKADGDVIFNQDKENNDRNNSIDTTDESSAM